MTYQQTKDALLSQNVCTYGGTHYTVSGVIYRAIANRVCVFLELTDVHKKQILRNRNSERREVPAELVELMPGVCPEDLSEDEFEIKELSE